MTSNARLFTPSPAPPPLAALERSRLRATLHTLTSAWRAGSNLLHMVHPELETRRWMWVSVGKLRMLNVNDAALARHVLGDRSERYQKSHLYHALLTDLLGADSSLLSEGEAAQFKRRLLGAAFNARALKRIEDKAIRHVDAALARWAALGEGAEINLSEEAPKLAMEVAMDAFFSASLGDGAGRMARILDELVSAAGSPSLADVINLPAWVPRRSRRLVRRHIGEVDARLTALIDERAAQGDGAEQRDMLDVLLAARDPETGERLSRREVRNEVVTLFLAGHETTALSLAWGLDRLAREPAAQDALAAATLAAERAKGGPLDAAEARATALVPETYDEMLRLYPPAYVVGRVATAPDAFEDLQFRAGDQFQITIFMLHRNPRYWDDPGAFRPERFAGKARPAAFMPFGAGPRNCVGMAMARLEAHLLLARALPRLRFAPVGPPPEPVGKITLRTRAPIRVRVSAR